MFIADFLMPFFSVLVNLQLYLVADCLAASEHVVYLLSAVNLLIFFAKAAKMVASNVRFCSMECCRVQAAMSAGNQNKVVQARQAREVCSVRDERRSGLPTVCVRRQSTLVLSVSHRFSLSLLMTDVIL